MKLPLRWLKEYVDYRVTNEEFVERMMWRGFEVAAIEPELPGAEDVIVGRVESVARHENSDHLYVCRVNTGSETLQIVTGADNLFPGALVPVAPATASTPSMDCFSRMALESPSSALMKYSLFSPPPRFSAVSSVISPPRTVTVTTTSSL